MPRFLLKFIEISISRASPDLLLPSLQIFHWRSSASINAKLMVPLDRGPRVTSWHRWRQPRNDQNEFLEADRSGKRWTSARKASSLCGATLLWLRHRMTRTGMYYDLTTKYLTYFDTYWHAIGTSWQYDHEGASPGAAVLPRNWRKRMSLRASNLELDHTVDCLTVRPTCRRLTVQTCQDPGMTWHAMILHDIQALLY